MIYICIFLSRFKLHIGDNFILRKSLHGKLQIGRHLSVRSNVVFNISGHGLLKIGDDVFINDSTKINAKEKINIGNNVIIGQNVLIYDHDHDYKSNNIKYTFISAPIFIGDNTWIGSGVIILKGVKIGRNCVIAAGSVVFKDVPDNMLYYNERTEKYKMLSK